MKLKKLFKDIAVDEIRGSKEVEITGIFSNSKLVSPGSLFIAKKGLNVDGAKFIPDAIAAGAVAILSDMYDPFISDQVVQIIHPDTASIEAKLAAQYYNTPSDALFLCGITGTNGKTTTSYIVRHLLEGADVKTGLIGTIETIFGNKALPSSLTTSDVITNHKLFSEMIQSGCKAAVMEVSSHALTQNRVEGIEYDIAIFTNLTQDHLDYHHTMQEYGRAKSLLFSQLKPASSAKKKFPKAAVVNQDSPWVQEMIKGCKTRIFTYALDSDADLRATDIALTSHGTSFNINYLGKSYPFSWELIGRFNVYNCLAALSTGILYGIPIEKALPILSSFKTAPGRLERVPNKKGIHIFVDYAHTDDALRNVLETLREIKKGRLITVFGCGGNRDKDKRPKMGSVAEKLSDVIVVTSDNPRNEEPKSITDEILKGLTNPAKAHVILDRQEAISSSIKMAKKDDVVLIAGKGHETYQIFAHQTVSFDDRLAARM
jgi:UDP-N-acetylmuramoyl-L-alanyl-D-glutamate--2,6-diaminopimelate ligase